MSSISQLSTISQSSKAKDPHANPCQGQMGHRSVQRWTMGSLAKSALLVVTMLANADKAFGYSATPITGSNDSLGSHSSSRDLPLFSDRQTIATCLTKATEFSKIDVAPKDIQGISTELARRGFLTQQSFYDVASSLDIPPAFIDHAIRCVSEVCAPGDEEAEEAEEWREEGIKEATDSWKKALRKAEEMQASGLPSDKKAADSIFDDERRVAQVRLLAEEERAAGLVLPLKAKFLAPRETASQLTKHLMVRIEETLEASLGSTHLGQELETQLLKIVNRPPIDRSEINWLLLQVILWQLPARIEDTLYRSMRYRDFFRWIELTDYDARGELAEVVRATSDPDIKEQMKNLITLHFPEKWWISLRYSPSESTINQRVYYLENKLRQLVETASKDGSYLGRTQAIIVDV
ncbi:MAG: hypothetical protein NTX49_01585 [Chlamydiae bacterium]|nr:hypothetical protein [Chlamydiota bacterium]